MIVVGLNGGSGDLIQRGIEAGLLPAFQRLYDGGIHGNVWNLTTSSPAEWAAHLTGVNPRAGGVHGYLSRRRIYHGIGRARTEDLRVRTYPELLDEAGLSVGLVNLPPTYPPLKLENGFCVSGMLTPTDREDFTHPSDLADDLGEYEIGVLYENVRYSDFGEPIYGLAREGQELSVDALREDVLRVEGRRLDAAAHLMRERRPDLLAVLVADLEVLGRFTRHELEEMPLKETALMQLYRAVDGFLGRLMERESNRSILVFSGHGFKDRGTPETSSSERTLWSILRGTIGPWIPDTLKQTGGYAALYDALEGMAGATPSREDADEELPSGLIQTGFPNRRGSWALRSPDLEAGGRIDLRYLDLSALVLGLMGQPVPEAYEGSLPDRLREAITGSRRQSIDLEVDRGEPPPPNQALQEKIMEEL